MTLVKINKTEKDLIEKELASVSIGVRFYTIEQNEEMLLAEIDCNSLSSMWHIGKMIGHAITARDLQNWYK